MRIKKEQLFPISVRADFDKKILITYIKNGQSLRKHDMPIEIKYLHNNIHTEQYYYWKDIRIADIENGVGIPAIHKPTSESNRYLYIDGMMIQ